MSTKLRPILNYHGTIRGGGLVRKTLEQLMRSYRLPVPDESLPEADRLIQMFNAVPDKTKGDDFLFLFREPRRINPKRSRFVQLCQYFGVPKQKKKTFDASRSRTMQFAVNPFDALAQQGLHLRQGSDPHAEQSLQVQPQLVGEMANIWMNSGSTRWQFTSMIEPSPDEPGPEQPQEIVHREP